MSGVREFRREDVPEVAALWLKVFRQHKGPASEALERYFEDIFFDNPWASQGPPSLVYVQNGRGPVGFLGVIPRRMRFDGQELRVAVATQLMVADEARPAYPAAKLMRGFFAGEQELSWSDGANEAAERLWHSCGGKVALLYGMVWTRVLRPAQYLRCLLQRRRPTIARALPVALMCRAADALAPWRLAGSFVRPGMPPGTLDDNPGDETLLWCVQHLTGDRILRPCYDEQSLHWLLARAAMKKNHGRFEKCVVREPNGEIDGWFLYYIRAGDVAQVLQYGARTGALRKVIDQLCYRAWQQGAIAICGPMDPRFAKELESSHCRLSWPGYGVVMHSRSREILHAIYQGDAFLSRLEGEWWARFSDPDWSEQETPHPEPPHQGLVPIVAPRLDVVH